MADNMTEFDEDTINLIVTRLESMPSTMKLAIGNKGPFDKFQLIEHVKNNDSVGKTIIKMQLFYLRSLKEL